MFQIQPLDGGPSPDSKQDVVEEEGRTGRISDGITGDFFEAHNHILTYISCINSHFQILHISQSLLKHLQYFTYKGSLPCILTMPTGGMCCMVSEVM